MGFSATVVADSVNPDGDRLTTLETTIPKCLVGEFNTHRALSRNSASSRAIPVLKQIRKALADPFIPEQFGSAQAGMQSGPPLEGARHDYAVQAWTQARDSAVAGALTLLYDWTITPAEVTSGEWEVILGVSPAHADLGAEGRKQVVHKELVNRLLEPFMWTTILVTATDWSNFFALRDHPDAQPQIAKAARLMREAMEASEPEELLWGEWHLPLLTPAERDSLRDLGPRSRSSEARRLAQFSASRSAGVSYETHQRADQPKDLERYDKLVAGGHMSPLEHPAVTVPGRHANFSGFRQLRSFIPHEADFGARR